MYYSSFLISQEKEYYPDRKKWFIYKQPKPAAVTDWEQVELYNGAFQINLLVVC